MVHPPVPPKSPVKVIETSVSLKPDHVLRLNQAAELTLLSRSKVVTLLWKSMMRLNEKRIGLKGAVSYQESGSYETVHVSLDEIAYEQKLDLRRFYKMSASKVLAWAIELFLDDLVFKILHKSHQRPFVSGHFYQEYHLSVQFNQDSTEYTIRWGPK